MQPNYFEANLALLKKKFPKTADLVEKADDSGLTLVPMADGSFDLKRGDKLTYNGKPLEAAKQTIQSIKFTHPKLLVFYGVGLGYHVSDFFKINNKVSQYIILAEKSAATLKKALEVSDWAKVLEDPRVHFMLDVPENQLVEFMEDFLADTGSIIYSQALEVVIAPNSTREEQKYYIEAAKSLKEAVHRRNAMFICTPEDAYQGFMNIILNLKNCHNVPSIGLLKKKFQGKPGIIVSTGPSLKHSIPWLKTVGERAVITCSDSAVKVLTENGIKPHFAGSLERTPTTALVFEGAKPTPDTWLITNPIVSPKTYEAFQGPKISMMRPIGQLKWFFPEEELYFTGRSVAHMNYVTLRELGCDPIILVGQDLAYDPFSGDSHTKGVHPLLMEFGEKERQESINAADKTNSYVECNNGLPIVTTRWYKEFKESFETFFRKDGIKVYNVIPADYGAKINYATRVNPSDADSILGGEHFPIRDMIREHLGSQQKLSLKAYSKQQYARLDSALDNLRKFKKFSIEMLDALSQFFFVHPPSIHGEKAEIYRPFLKKLEIAANTLCNTQEDDFYFYFLYSMTMDQVISISQSFQGLFGDDTITKTQRLEKQFNYIMNWFASIHFWASRAEGFIQRHYATLFSETQKNQPVSESAGAQSASV